MRRKTDWGWRGERGIVKEERGRGGKEEERKSIVRDCRKAVGGEGGSGKRMGGCRRKEREKRKGS